jgi:hypothetical protein
MSVSLTSVRAFVAQHRLRSEVVGVSLLALAVFAVLGAQARRALPPARAELDALRAAASEVATFRSAFLPSAPEHDARLAASIDSLGLAIGREDRVRITHRLTATAESVGLRAVKVRFAGLDSAVAPARPDLIRTNVGVADYALAISCSGDFASVLSLIARLPASVALQRIVAVREDGATRYDVILAVFETSAKRVGRVGSPDGPRG